MIFKFRSKIAIAAICALFSTGCKDVRELLPLPFNKKKLPDHWVYKMSDTLHLAVFPLGRNERPLDKVALRAEFPDPQMPDHLLGKIYFFVPGETALKNPELYEKQSIFNKVDENVVEIVSIKPWTKEMHQNKPPDGKDARMGWANRRLDISFNNKYEIIHGMKCYRLPEGNGWRSIECLAERKPGEWATVSISEIYEGGAPNPSIKARYYSAEYGGLSIMWMASAKQAHRWKEIDEKMWKLIDSWNVAK